MRIFKQVKQTRRSERTQIDTYLKKVDSETQEEKVRKVFPSKVKIKLYHNIITSTSPAPMGKEHQHGSAKCFWSHTPLPLSMKYISFEGKNNISKFS